jgi:hypothetical protein
MTSGDTVLNAFSDFVIDEIPAEAPVVRRTLRRLEDADNSISPGPITSDVRTAPASGIVVELETQLVELQK